MTVFSDNFRKLLQKANATPLDVAIDLYTDASNIRRLLTDKGKPDGYVTKLCGLKRLAPYVKEWEMWAWVIADRYSSQAIQLANTIVSESPL